MSTVSGDSELERVRRLRGQELVDELQYREWHVQPNDLIGGFSVMPVDQPPSSGWPEIADFLSKEHAQHIVTLHNAWFQLLVHYSKEQTREAMRSIRSERED